MELILEKPIVEEIGLDILRQFKINASEYDWEHTLTVSLIYFNKNQVLDLQQCIEKTTCNEKIPLLKIIEQHLEMLDNPCAKIKTVEMGATALIGYIGLSKGYRIYVRNINNKKYYAYRVSNIRYIPPSTNDRRHVTIGVVYDQFTKRKTESLYFYAEDLRGLTAIEALDRKFIFLENNERRDNYLREKQYFEKIYANVGEQYLLNGIATDDIPANDNYTITSFNSKNHRVVIDVFDETTTKKRYRGKTHNEDYDDAKDTDVGLSFWKKQRRMFEHYINDKDVKKETFNKQVEIPTHPDVIIFDLLSHMRLVCHPDFLTLYQYLDNIEDSLIIPQNSKRLIHHLINHSEEEFNDIVRDKSGGLLMMLTGSAGVGKTLTVEVFAEIKKRPLFVIQSSQLGIEPDKIEENLKKCFDRSIRWNAVLLIDEADVYVHKRNEDLKQNAVVGTFLRMLEYFPTLLFMTTNRADIIDDAIVSRCIVVMQYERPTIQEQEQIWRVLSKSLECNLEESEIKKICNEFKDFTGRDIKNMLKLCRISNDSNNITCKKIQSLVNFNPTLKEVNHK